MGEYKIKDIETLTGIKAHTLRIWEKRYSIPQPERTETKIRTYSDQDLTQLLNVSLLNKSGMKISHIAHLDRQQLNQKVNEILKSQNGDLIFDKLILALIDMNEQLFTETFNLLIAEHGILKTFSTYINEFLTRIGIMWMTGSINPVQEHFMSNLIRQKIISATDKLPTISEKDIKVILFLPEHETHEISLLLINYILKNKGYHTYYLGQSVPFEALKECIDIIKPSSLISSWTTSIDEKFTQNYCLELSKSYPEIAHYFGGQQMFAIKALSSKNLIKIKSLEEFDVLFK